MAINGISVTWCIEWARDTRFRPTIFRSNAYSRLTAYAQ